MNMPRTALVAALTVSQILGWGTTYEMPAVFGRAMAADLGLANETAFAGLTVMMLVMAFLGPWTGQQIARHGASKILATGSVLMAAGLTVLALSTGLVLYAIAWLILGVGGSFALTVPAFAAVVEREGRDARRAIGILMVFTGLSSAVCWPLLTLAGEALGWRGALLAAAAVQLLVVMPVHLAIGRIAITRSDEDRAADAVEPLDLTRRMAVAAFLLIALSSSLSSLMTFGLSPQLLHILELSGATPALALELGSLRAVFGISARAVDLVLGKRTSPITTGLAGSAMLTASTLLLIVFSGTPSSLLLFTALYGFGSGVSALARATMPLSFFSASRFARQSARLALPQNLANATAPVLMTAVIDRAGIDAGLVLATAFAATGFFAILGLAMIARRTRPICPLAGESGKSKA
ncbi:MFS transporter [Rhizobium sp. Root274]|uniref:MFS transporter n=1 Tax=unclassified Rhizobium TaxID=2613769 RepID=UPI000714742B|nr:MULTISPECIES: MFS transporter [unclassified Rhizobium]KQW31138.1 MFS transporter [Rhizobium sp. Root1240]KRD32686.1 MFS transporter [Rhizobium sp. Root274]